jgi:4-amino-4-deoxy-L-arabinose transferase-like glycosyltransferase
VALCILLIAYVVAGVFGRYPWKPDEPYSFGIAWGMLEDHDWLVTRVADQPFVEKPPLVYWLGALFAQALPQFPAHESSRVAVLLLVLVASAALYGSARSLWPEALRFSARLPTTPTSGAGPTAIGVQDARTYGVMALALAGGTLGFTEQIHKFTADLGQLAGAAIALYGIVRVGTAAARRPMCASRRAALSDGLAIGVGTGVAFLSKGLLIPGVVALTGLVCLALPAYRSRAALTSASVAAVTVVPWLLTWPIALHHAAPQLFEEWLWTHNIGRFLGVTQLGGNHVPLPSKLGSLMWSAFPSLVLICWLVSRFHPRNTGRIHDGRSTLRHAAGHVGVAVYTVVLVAVLLASRSFRDNYLLPVLPGFVLLALPVAACAPNRFTQSLKTGLDRAFALAATIVILVWLQLVFLGTLTPWLGKVAGRFLPLPFRLSFAASAASAVIGGVLLWLYIVRRDRYRSAIVSWCAGIAMLWLVAMALLLPWFDAARSYRKVFRDVAGELIAPNCLATWNLGESELAMLEYVAGIEATRIYLGHSGAGDRSRPNAVASTCDWMLVLSNRRSGPLAPAGSAWEPVWRGSRPGDRNERFALFHRS